MPVYDLHLTSNYYILLVSHRCDRGVGIRGSLVHTKSELTPFEKQLLCKLKICILFLFFRRARVLCNILL